MARVNTIQDGGVIFRPVLDTLLRTVHSKPQVVLTINNIVSKCSGSCDFEWIDSVTPNVETIDTSIIGLYFGYL